MDYKKVANAVLDAFASIEITGSMLPWGPVADGEVFLGNPLDTGFHSEVKDVPIVVGSSSQWT